MSLAFDRAISFAPSPTAEPIPRESGAPPPRALSHYDLLARILSRALESPARFADAQRVVAGANPASAGNVRGLARELLSDLTIRDWIAFVRVERGRDPATISRTRHEIELAGERNWGPAGEQPEVRYTLTDRGRRQAVSMLRLG